MAEIETVDVLNTDEKQEEIKEVDVVNETTEEKPVEGPNGHATPQKHVKGSEGPKKNVKKACCEFCNKEMYAASMAAHKRTCKKAKALQVEAVIQPVVEQVSQPVSQPVPQSNITHVVDEVSYNEIAEASPVIPPVTQPRKPLTRLEKLKLMAANALP